MTTNIVSTLVVATTSPPIAGPMRKARLSMVLDAPLAAVSSPGWDVSEGSQASWAGRNTHPTSGASVARTSTTQAGASTTRATTAAATSPARTRVETRRTALRERRSTTVEPKGVATAMRASRTPAQSPTRAAPPSRYAQTVTAVEYAQSPTSEAARASCIRLREGLANTARRARHVSPRAARPLFGRASGCSVSTATASLRPRVPVSA